MIFEVLVRSLNICSKIPSNAIHNNGIDPTDQDMRGLEEKGHSSILSPRLTLTSSLRRGLARHFRLHGMFCLFNS